MTTELDEKLPIRAAQLTGLGYLAMFITGILAFLVIRPRLFVAGDASATMMRLADNEWLARMGLVADLGLITAGAVTALLFFALFQRIDSALSTALLAFGFMGTAVTTVGTVFSAAALQIAVGGLNTNEDPANLVLLLVDLKETAWSVGALFFGLWLIPMGWLALRSGWMPRLLGWALIVGGFGYIASCVLDQLQPQASVLVEALTMPASLAELSMLIFLLTRRRARSASGDHAF